MAVVKMPQNGSLQFKVQTGLSSTGSPVYATRSFSGLKPNATDDAVYAIASGLAGLQTATLVDIIRADKAYLINE